MWRCDGVTVVETVSSYYTFGDGGDGCGADDNIVYTMYTTKYSPPVAAGPINTCGGANARSSCSSLWQPWPGVGGGRFSLVLCPQPLLLLFLFLLLHPFLPTLAVFPSLPSGHQSTNPPRPNRSAYRRAWPAPCHRRFLGVCRCRPIASPNGPPPRRLSSSVSHRSPNARDRRTTTTPPLPSSPS